MEEEEEELPVDYAFLDEDETSDYNDIRSDTHSMRRRRGVESEPCLETAAHIVFRRRRPEQETHHSDYSEYWRQERKKDLLRSSRIY